MTVMVRNNSLVGELPQLRDSPRHKRLILSNTIFHRTILSMLNMVTKGHKGQDEERGEEQYGEATLKLH